MVTLRRQTAQRVAVAIWRLPDGSIVEQRIAKAEYDALGSRDQPQPGVGAEFLMAFDMPALDTSDGYPRAGDAWEVWDGERGRNVLRVALTNGLAWSYSASAKTPIDATTAREVGVRLYAGGMQEFASYDVRDLSRLALATATAPTTEIIDQVVPDHHSIAYVSQADGQSVGGSSLTISYTQASGTDTLLIGSAAYGGVVVTTTSMTYNGTGFTAVPSAYIENNTRIADMWYLVNPAVTTANFVVTPSATPSVITASVHSWTGVDQTTPVRTAQTATGNGTSLTMTYTAGVTNDVIVATARGNGTHTVNAPLTAIIGRVNLGVGYKASDGDGSDSIDFTATTSNFWVLSATALIPSGDPEAGLVGGKLLHGGLLLHGGALVR